MPQTIGGTIMAPALIGIGGFGAVAALAGNLFLGLPDVVLYGSLLGMTVLYGFAFFSVFRSG
jgi:hypothetical protein